MNAKGGKIALLISSYLPNLGGMEVGLHNIALELIDQGKEPIVIAPWTHVRQLRRLRWDLPYQVETLPPKIWSLLSISPSLGFRFLDWWLGRLEAKHQFEFWHVTMAYPTGCAIVHFAENAKQDVKYLIRCAGEDIQRNNEIGYGLRLVPSLDRQITYFLRRAERLVAITDSVYQEYVQLGVSPNHIRRVPNGVPLKRFSKVVDTLKIRREYNLTEDDYVLLCVGRNHPKKNYETLIKAFSECWKKREFNAKLVCIGKDVSRLQGLVEEIGLSEHVRLIEEVGGEQENSRPPNFPSDELIDTYKMSDLFVFPSRTETFGIAIVEAMAAGLPVIVGDSEGCRDIVERGKWGVMVPPDDFKQLAKSISRIASDTSLQAELREKSLERCQDFSWERVVRLYLEIYQEPSATDKESVS